MDMDKAFEMIEKLSEELGEKETKIMRLEKNLDEEEKEKKELLDKVEIYELCGDIFCRGYEHYGPDNIPLCEWIDEIYMKINRKWDMSMPLRTGDDNEIELSVGNKLMPIALNLFFDRIRLGMDAYQYKERQKTRFMPIYELRKVVVYHIESLLSNYFEKEDDEFDDDNEKALYIHTKELLEFEKDRCEADFGNEENNGEDCFLQLEDSMDTIYQDNYFIEEIMSQDMEEYQVLDVKFKIWNERDKEEEKMYMFVDVYDYRRV
jgi:hypothetical protein